MMDVLSFTKLFDLLIEKNIIWKVVKLVLVCHSGGSGFYPMLSYQLSIPHDRLRNASASSDWATTETNKLLDDETEGRVECYSAENSASS